MATDDERVDREKVHYAAFYHCIHIFMCIFVIPLIKQTCPLLLRVFVMESQHHRPEEFSKKKVPDNELQIYTWYGHHSLDK